MSENKFVTIAVKRDPTLHRLQRLGHFGESYDDILTKLLNRCEREILEQQAEEALTVTQR